MLASCPTEFLLVLVQRDCEADIKALPWQGRAIYYDSWYSTSDESHAKASKMMVHVLCDSLSPTWKIT